MATSLSHGGPPQAASAVLARPLPDRHHLSDQVGAQPWEICQLCGLCVTETTCIRRWRMVDHVGIVSTVSKSNEKTRSSFRLSGRKPAIVTPCNMTYLGEMMLRYGVQYIHVSPQKSRFPAVVVVASCLEVHWWPHRFALATRRTHQHETRLRKRNRKGLHHHAQFILISPLHSPSFCILGLPSVFWSSILLPSSPIGTNKAVR